MFDFYPTCLEKTKHVGIFTPGCYFPHMFGFWHICMGKGTHVWKKPHNYMFANVCHFPHMCGKSHWHAYFRLSYLWMAVECCTFLALLEILPVHWDICIIDSRKLSGNTVSDPAFRFIKTSFVWQTWVFWETPTFVFLALWNLKPMHATKIFKNI